MNLKMATSNNNFLLSEEELECFDNEIDENNDSSSIDNDEVLMNE